MNKLASPSVVLCDLDGVVWLAHQPIAGSVEAIAKLRSNGMRVVFVTNNSFSTYAEQVSALGSIGVAADGDIVTSAIFSRHCRRRLPTSTSSYRDDLQQSQIERN